MVSQDEDAGLRVLARRKALLKVRFSLGTCASDHLEHLGFKDIAALTGLKVCAEPSIRKYQGSNLRAAGL